MTIASADSVLPEDRFVGWTGVGNRFREFARIRHQQRTHDSFRNHPCGKPILLCLVRNAGMHEEEQMKLLAEAHAILVDEAAWLYICHDLNPRAMSKNVKNFRPAQSWSQDFTQITMG